MNEYLIVFLLTGLTGLLRADWIANALYGRAQLSLEASATRRTYRVVIMRSKVPTQKGTTSQRVARKISGGGIQTESTCITNYK